jgi:ABC-type multidrug transport system ATPase subunit
VCNSVHFSSLSILKFDAHFENMTGREHLKLYAVVKGIPNDIVDEVVSKQLAEVGLEHCADQLSSEYSGGMKRRLSLACALVGNPLLIFLDECTTGVDPVARRDIWKVILGRISYGDQQSGRIPCIIITTHSMEECGTWISIYAE